MEGTGYPNIFKKEYDELCFETIQITILSAENKIKFIINSILNKYIELSEFQDIMIKIFSNVVGEFPSSKEYYETNSLLFKKGE